MQKQFYGKKLEGKGCKQMKLCNKDCFHCIYDDCIADNTIEKQRIYKKKYYQEHKEEIKAKRRERYRRKKEKTS